MRVLIIGSGWIAAECAKGSQIAHSIDKVSESPLKLAAPFRTLHERYPVGSLEETLAEGMVTGHREAGSERLVGLR